MARFNSRTGKTAGRRGGITTAKRYGRDFIESRAAKGGAACRTLYGQGFYRKIAQDRVKKT